MKQLLSAIACCVMVCFGISAQASPGYAPVFVHGHSQTLSVCQNGGAYSINALLTAYDQDMGDAENWTLLAAPAHGTAAVTYTTTSAADTMYTASTFYIPTAGYSGADSFSVVVSDGYSADTTMVYVTVMPLPVAGTITGPSVVCDPSMTTLSASTTGGIWIISFPVGFISPGGILTTTISGSATIGYIQSNSCGSDTAFHPITVVAYAYAGFSSGSTTVCNGATVSVTPVQPGGTWSASNSNITISGSTLTGAAAGLDTLTYVVTNACSSDTSITTFTVVDPLTTAGTISGSATACEGASITFTATDAGGTWSHTASSGSISTSGVLTAGAETADTVIYTFTNACGSVAATAPVAITPLPDAGVIYGYDSVCLGGTITLTSSVGGGTWSSSIPDFAAIDAAGVVYGGLHGSTVISYSVTNVCGTSSATHNIDVNIPAQPISGSATICQGQPEVYLDGVGGGTWGSNNPLCAVPVSFLAPGTYFGGMLGATTITYTVNNACGETTAELDVEVIDCSTSAVLPVDPAKVAMVIAPNPNAGNFTLTLSAGKSAQVNVAITNMLGQVVMQRGVNTNSPSEFRLDVPAGLYTVTATLDSKVYTAKVTVN